MYFDLSILIPVYNQNVTPLVKALHQQCKEAGIRFEIRCYDDASTAATKSRNQTLNQLDHVFYLELQHNIGRSAIRNLLAHEAQYDYLLFLDNDNQISRPDFIQRYQQVAKPESIVLGGTAYAETQPSSAHLLRWVYGRAREEKPAHVRSRHPYRQFSINNTLIWRETFLRIGLDERLREYGFEDVVFGMKAERGRLTVLHIDNPVIHLGLDRTEHFLEKTKEAVRNLYKLTEIPAIRDHSSLLRAYRLLQKMGLTQTFLRLYKNWESRILRNLHGAQPNLLYYDLYRLKLLVELATSKKAQTQKGK